MKRILVVCFLILSIGIVKAQDSVLFKIKYLPNHTYKFVGNNTMSFYVDLSSNKEVASKLASQGITQPMNAVIHYNTGGTTTTSSIRPDHSFPLIMNLNPAFIVGTLNGKQIPIPTRKTDTKFYGQVGSNGTLSIYSLNGKKLNDSAVIAIKKMMNKVMSMVNFPERAIKIGDSFSYNIPFDIPLGKVVVINVDMTYKLISIINGKAYFDITQGLDMQMPVKQININITGTGVGKLVYDIKNNFPVSLNSNILMTINVRSDKFSGGATANVFANNTYTIN